MSRLSKHAAQFNLSEPFQSAYEVNHSSVQNDFSLAKDNQKEGVLIFLDLSAAFDTVNHIIVIKRLLK